MARLPGITITGYNVQSVVDDKHKLIIASDVTNAGNDLHQLHRMAKMAKEMLDADELEALADAGFHDSKELAKCENDDITTFVPEPKKISKAEKDGRFTRDSFNDDIERNVYKCPSGEELVRQGRPFERNGKIHRRFASKTICCKGCPLRDKCLSKTAKTRLIYRSEYEDVVERQRVRMRESKGKMRERAGLVEHPFGTLKHRAGWTHFLVRGFEKVGGEWALMVTSYNFTRVLNIIGFEAFRDYCLQRRDKREKSVISHRLCRFIPVILPFLSHLKIITDF